MMPAAVCAQTQTPARRTTTNRPKPPAKWEISAFGGVVDAGIPIQGFSGSLPLLNPLFTTVNGRLSRTVPTWFFGNGATFFGQVASQAQIPEHLADFNTTVFGPGSTRGNGWTVGARVARILNPRAQIEGTFEYSGTSIELLDATIASVEPVRAAFVTAWTALLATEPGTFSGTAVTATSAIDKGSQHQIVASGAVLINILTKKRNTPYVVVGVGLMQDTGTSPAITLNGRITTMVNGSAPIDETDTMTLKYTLDRTLVEASLGLGIKRMMSERWGVRGEMRIQLSGNPLTQVASLSPVRVLTSNTLLQGAGATNKPIAVQFSNVSGSTPISSLAGGADEPTFRGTGMEARLHLTGGMFWRF